MNILKARIQRLPQELQDLIAEYNVEHRTITKRIIEEFNHNIDKKCEVCGNSVSSNFWSCDYFINLRCNIENFWCGEECYNNTEVPNEQIRTMYETYKYMDTTSILFNKSYKLFHNSEWRIEKWQ